MPNSELHARIRADGRRDAAWIVAAALVAISLGLLLGYLSTLHQAC